MRTGLSAFVPTVRLVRLSNSVALSLCSPKRLRRKTPSFTNYHGQIRSGIGSRRHLSWRVYVLWMSGRRHRGNLEKSGVHISKKSFGVDVKAFGFLMTVFLHTSRAVIT